MVWFGGMVVCKPILVFSLAKAEQFERILSTHPSETFVLTQIVRPGVIL